MRVCSDGAKDLGRPSAGSHHVSFSHAQSRCVFRLAEALTCEQKDRDLSCLGFRASECRVLHLLDVLRVHLTLGGRG